MNNPYQNPYYYSYPNYTYQQTQAMPQQTMQSPMTDGFQWVQGLEGAKAYIVPAGHKVWLMDSENATFYIKETDASGMPKPMRIFDFTERKETVKAESVDMSQYVKKSELRDYINQLLTETEPINARHAKEISNEPTVQ